MSDNILIFKKPSKLKAKRAKKSLGMCQHGFHKWVALKDTVFDSKRGKLVTAYRCKTCGTEKTKAH